MIPDLNQQLRPTIDQAELTRQEAERQLSGGALTRLWGGIQKRRGQIPVWARNHLVATRNLNELAAAYQRQGQPLPAELVTTLRHCRALIGAISEQIGTLEVVRLMQPIHPAVPGSGGLLSSTDKGARIPKSAMEWQVNFGLMVNAYKRASSPEVKKEIAFLALNYLAKAAPISMERLRNVLSDLGSVDVLQELFNLGFFVEHDYHRERSKLDQTFQFMPDLTLPAALSPSSNAMLDTPAVDQLFPLWYNPIDLSAETGADQVTSLLLAHAQAFADKPWEQPLTKPMIIDLTATLAQHLFAGQDEQKTTAFNERLEEARSNGIHLIQQTIEKIKKSHPELLNPPMTEKKMAEFIRENLVAVCRAPVRDYGIITTVPLFGSSLVGIDDFIKLTGLRMGAVAARQRINDFTDLPQLIARSDLVNAEYWEPGSQDVIYFPDAKSVTRTQLFTRFSAAMDDAYAKDPHSPVSVLGKGTMALVQGLLDEVPAETWTMLNRDPADLDESARRDHLARRMLFQSSLFRLTQHLAQAQNNKGDFTEFSSAIELAHCEIATLLALTKPFKPEDFSGIYQQQLTFVPTELQPMVTCGITKTAMNTFAGVCSAVQASAEHPELVHGQDSYFESVFLIGKNSSIGEVLANPDVKQVDLYVGEFNHNININADYHHYTAGDVIGDVEKLMKEKPAKHLTVVVDSTIDLVNSPRHQAILTRFSKEIQEGRLNFVFMRSGQKFEMFGMDNYYGAPYYMVNNGGDQWKTFANLNNDAAFRTDPLSVQWFCLANKYAAQQLDDYRATIFANGRDLLQRVPPALTQEGAAARVSTVDDTMEPAFIDIKITDQRRVNRRQIEDWFYTAMATAGRKAHSRGSFGFYHPNFNFIDDTVLRINPGLDPKDNEVITSVLNEIATAINP